MTQTPMQKAVEAMHIAFNSRRGAFPDEDWNVALTAALASLEADGWKLMPREATEEINKLKATVAMLRESLIELHKKHGSTPNPFDFID
jgi:hypothetical protein